MQCAELHVDLPALNLLVMAVLQPNPLLDVNLTQAATHPCSADVSAYLSEICVESHQFRVRWASTSLNGSCLLLHLLVSLR